MTVKITREIHGTETTIVADTSEEAIKTLLGIDADLAAEHTEMTVDADTIYAGGTQDA